MRNFKRIIAVLLVVACLFAASMTATAADYTDSAYDVSSNWTTSSSDKEMVYVKPMYDTQPLVDAADLGIAAFTELSDIHAAGGYVYLLDGGAGRLVILDKDMNFVKEITQVTHGDETLTFVGAEGVNVEENGKIYISDTKNCRVIITDDTGVVEKILTLPDSDLWPADLHYNPTKVVVDKLGYVYVLCKGSYYGAAMYTPEYEFQGFYGANVTTTSVVEAINNLWDVLFTNTEKLSRCAKVLPFSFVDMVVGPDGYVYTCTSASSWSSKGVVRRLNPTGNNILIDKSGETAQNSSDVNFGTMEQAIRDRQGVVHSFSSITVDDNNYIHLLDTSYGRIYVYDTECNLLNAFGGGIQKFITQQEGTFRAASAITSMDGVIYVLDTVKAGIVSYKINDYGLLVQEAQTLTLNGDYTEAAPLWEEVLKNDRNCILAYRGLAKAYMIESEYEKAMEYARLGFDRVTYSKAYEYVRQNFLSEYFTYIFIGAILLVVALVLVLRYKKKKGIVLIKNKKLSIALGTLMHPADSFYEIKRNNNGSVLIATLIVAAWYVFKIIGMTSGFIFNKSDINDVNAWYAIAQTFGLVLLFVVANWLVCVLFQGKGKLKEIYVGVCYSLLPMVIQAIGYDVLANVLTLEEQSFIDILNYVCIVLTAVYLIMALINIHEFTFARFVGTTIVTLLAMVLIIFLAFLIGILLQQSAEFISTIVSEVLYR